MVAIVYKPYTLSIIMKPCHEMELEIAQASEGCDVQLEFHEWQDKYMTVPTLGLVYITHPFMYVISACSSILYYIKYYLSLGGRFSMDYLCWTTSGTLLSCACSQSVMCPNNCGHGMAALHKYTSFIRYMQPFHCLGTCIY